MFQFLVFSWALTMGFVPQQQDCVNSSMVQIDSTKIATVTSLDIGVIAWDRLEIYTKVETFQYLCQDSIGFAPYRADYTFGINYSPSKVVTFGLMHECDHAIVSTINLSNNDYMTDYKYARGETQMFVKIGTRQ